MVSNIINNLQLFVIDKNELKDSLKRTNSCLHKTFQSCFEENSDLKIKENKQLEIESILDYLHDEMNTGHWSEISVDIRRAFTAASYIKTLITLQSAVTYDHSLLEKCLKTIDMGLLLGAPLEVNSGLLTSCATFLSQKLDAISYNSKEMKITSNKRRHSVYSDEFEKLKGVTIDSLSCPSLETFNKYFSSKTPLKLQECITHWSALTKWTDLNYLLKIAGGRTVPVEIGSHYADENWQQKLMTLTDFIKRYFLEDSENIGYLAQHNLFNQIPELRNDIYVPEYCCLSDLEESEEPDINAWFGPAKTVSPLHQDPKNNILVQVFGTKQLILYSPNDSPNLYPHDTKLLSNTAQVDPFKPDFSKFPHFEKATAYKCILKAGEMLYIPPKWWHHVTALEKSFSVSFWWN